MQETNQSGFRLWLCNTRGYQPRPIKDAVSRCRRVERHYGDLDDLYDKDRLVSLLEHLVCTLRVNAGIASPFVRAQTLARELPVCGRQSNAIRSSATARRSNVSGHCLGDEVADAFGGLEKVAAGHGRVARR